jgi:hypothetical protein
MIVRNTVHIKGIYNWVKVSSRVFSCDDPDKRDYEKKLSTYPGDMRWREIVEETAVQSELGEIIY